MTDLDDLLIKMAEAEENADIEDAHCDADELLCEAVRRLGGEQGADLVASYERVGKWYA